MKDFTLSGAALFEPLPDPVLWVESGRIVYLNPAARALAASEGWPLAEDAPLPELLQYEPGSRSVFSLPGGWLCSVRPMDGGDLILLQKGTGDTAFSMDRLNQLAGLLRQPLGNIIGTAQLLDRMNGKTDPDKVRRYQAVQKHNYHVLLRMVENMELVGALGSGTAFRPHLMDFGGFCVEVVRSCESLAAMAGINIQLDVRGKNLLVNGEEHLLERMIYQLLSNAGRAAGDGGTILLRLEQQGKMLRLVVRDSGPGFDENTLINAFDPAVAPERLNSVDGGLGLGIPLCRMIVERHGGRMALVGADFGCAVVELPLSSGATGSVLRTEQFSYSEFQAAKVQLADILPWQCYLPEEE